MKGVIHMSAISFALGLLAFLLFLYYIMMALIYIIGTILGVSIVIRNRLKPYYLKIKFYFFPPGLKL